MRLGEALVEAGILSLDQVQAILNRQRESGRPFGAIAEEEFGIDPGAIEEAWAVQYARITSSVDPVELPTDPACRDLVTRRQAWQFRVIPVRYDDSELMMVTTAPHLRRALRFATNVIGEPVYFVLADPMRLGEALCLHYPLPGMTAASVNDSMMDALLAPLVSLDDRH